MALFVLSVASNAREIERTLDAMGRRQIPFAASQATNRLAEQIVKVDLPAKMREVFDRPTPFVQKGFAWRKATKRSLTAEIFARENAGKGNPAWKALAPETFGGTRNMKRFERALQSVVGGAFAVPGRGARLNQYGNISAGEIERILSALGAAERTSGYLANRTARSAKRRGAKLATYFIAHARDDGSPLGVYRVVGGGKVEPVLIFAKKAPRYSARLPYFETAQDSFARHVTPFMKDALAKALATAKPA